MQTAFYTRVLALIALLTSTATVVAFDLANGPLLTATSVTVKPNIFFILDDSGSMQWEYMPDHVNRNSNLCRRWVANNSSRETKTFCFARDDGAVDDFYSTFTPAAGDPPYHASQFNKVYYNPRIRYIPPLKYDGTSYISMTSSNTSAWSSVPKDGFATAPFSNTYNINGNLPEVYYCKLSNTADCKRNGIDSTSYQYPNNTKGSGATGLVNWYAGFGTSSTSNPIAGPYVLRRVMKTAVPYYWDITPTEYCTSAHLENCKLMSAPAGLYQYPASVRYCYNSADASNTNVEVSGTTKAGGKDIVRCQAIRDNNHLYARYGSFSRVNISSGANYEKYPDRKDCAGSVCTYDEEMTNFANWFSYYRTRVSMMKSASGFAFDRINSDYRVGFTTINNRSYADSNKPFLDIKDFDLSHRQEFYSKLYGTVADGGTPLRGALSRAGKYYAGSIFSGARDPVQYSCQQNFTILTTDGYWTTGTGIETDTFGPYKLDGSLVGDQDGIETEAPVADFLKKSNTLADVARYYYLTDLRTSGYNPKGALNTDVHFNDVRVAGDDKAPHQHMTTFTMGLGADGTLLYEPDYKANSMLDYRAILQKSKFWPDPINNVQGERIDDLWHAAENAGGSYYSAGNSNDLALSFKKLFDSMMSSNYNGAAAAASTLNPVSGDNFLYLANYQTLDWYGDMISFTISGDGTLNPNEAWGVDANAVPLGVAHKLQNRTEPRIIHTWGGAKADKLRFFSAGDGGFSSGELNAYFDTSKLTQYNDWNEEQKKAATPTSLVDYLRGSGELEVGEGKEGVKSLYRARKYVLGDIVNAQPVHVGSPPHDYADPGYADFKVTKKGRIKVVYLAANDGMLHAINAQDGQELWAYVPKMVWPNLYKLANDNYGLNHQYFVDGTPTVGDVYFGGEWRTILVGGLGKGGRGYYALDITDPETPKALWNFTEEMGSHINYSYGRPIITKRKSDGKWVALLSSGYSESGDMTGALYVVDAITGEKLHEIVATGSKGIARFSAWVENGKQNNTAEYVYAGDLNGNLWRFDVSDSVGPAGLEATKLGVAKDAKGNAQPITVTPELMKSKGKRLIVFSTGKLLSSNDISDEKAHSLYVLKDDGQTDNPDPLRSFLKQTALTEDAAPLDMNWAADTGWFADFATTGEKTFVDPQIILGTVFISTLVPKTEVSACSPQGSSKGYWIRVSDGDTLSVTSYATPILGQTTVQQDVNLTQYLTPLSGQPIRDNPPDLSSGDGVSDTRVSWRELFND